MGVFSKFQDEIPSVSMRGVEVPGLLRSDASVLAVVLMSSSATALGFEGGVSDSVAVELLQPMLARKAPQKERVLGTPCRAEPKEPRVARAFIHAGTCSREPLTRKAS